MPITFPLYQNYPNPFNPSTTIAFDLTNSGHVRLEVFNILGQRVKRLVDEQRAAGKYAVEWDGKDDRGKRIASGVYFYRLQTDEAVRTRKMVPVK